MLAPGENTKKIVVDKEINLRSPAPQYILLVKINK